MLLSEREKALHKEAVRKWARERDKDERNQYCRDYRLKIKYYVIHRYSQGKMECSCCGEKHLEFLTIDHVDGGGNQHRKSLGKVGGTNFYVWLRKNHYPEGFRVLCHNCNVCLGNYGYCPHQTLNNKITMELLVK